MNDHIYKCLNIIDAKYNQVFEEYINVGAVDPVKKMQFVIAVQKIQELKEEIFEYLNLIE